MSRHLFFQLTRFYKVNFENSAGEKYLTTSASGVSAVLKVQREHGLVSGMTMSRGAAYWSVQHVVVHVAGDYGEGRKGKKLWILTSRREKPSLPSPPLPPAVKWCG